MGSIRHCRCWSLSGGRCRGVWTRIEELRAEFRTVADWPTWSFAPTAVAYPIAGDQPMLAAKLMTLAAWRMTKGIYRFDPTLMAALVDTPLDAAVPVDVLRRLPEWCIYLDSTGFPLGEGRREGCGSPWSELVRPVPARSYSSSCSTLSEIWTLR